MRLSSFAVLCLPLLSFASVEPQIPMDDIDYTPLTTPKPTLADLLTIEPSASIFYSYARELELSSMFANPGMRATVFVPTNKAVISLPRKPHEGTSADGDIKISDEEYDKQSKENVQRWVSAHIIPESPISLLESTAHLTLLEGKTISFTPISKSDGNGPEWSRVSLDGGIRILGMKEGLNGVVYMIDGNISAE